MNDELLIFNDLWYAVDVDLDSEVAVSFKIRDVLSFNQEGDAELGEVIIDGWVKWDGCSDWNFTDDCYHFCSKEQAMRIGVLFGKLYDYAEQAIPHSDFD